jgi:ADP-ribose pyrophosphatase
MVKRGNQPGRGIWSVPGGLVKVGERIQDAALREVREETGLRVGIDSIFDVVDHITHDSNGRVHYHYVIVDFLGHPIRGRLKASSDSADARWIHINDLKKYKLPRSLRDAFKRKGLI